MPTAPGAITRIKLEDYKPVAQSATCNRCKSTTVSWEKSKTGKMYLVEIFKIMDEEVASRSDFHSYYCTSSGVGRQSKLMRQALINKLVDEEWADDSKPEEPKPEPETPSEINTDGHPYCCENCGDGIIDGADGLYYNFIDDKIGRTHTCRFDTTTPMTSARAKGSKVARNVKFADISERMDSIQRMLEEYRRDNNGANPATAELSAEYLMLRKRLFTEIPS